MIFGGTGKNEGELYDFYELPHESSQFSWREVLDGWVTVAFFCEKKPMPLGTMTAVLASHAVYLSLPSFHTNVFL